jgi:RNA polymerase sigma-70 factor (ECF subfamily)
LSAPLDDRENRDKRLVARILAGEEAAFDQFIDDYYPRLFRFASVRLDGDPDATQDVVQGTFSKVIPSLARYRGEAALFSWLCSFCRFEIAAHWKARARRAPEVPLIEDAPNVRAALESLATAGESPQSELERRELARLVRTVLDHLPVRYGDALEWRYLRDSSVEAIAERLGVSYKAAESLLSRAREAFRAGFTQVVGGVTS